MADQNTRCKIYGNCANSPKSAEKGADLVIEDINTDAKGNPVTPADMEGESRSDIGKNVDVQLKQPVESYVESESRKKQLEGSEVNIGTVSVDAKTGETELHTPTEATPDKCDYSYMVGKKLSEITMPKKARVLHEGDAVTMDFSPNRVNIILDKSDVIVNVTCG